MHASNRANNRIDLLLMRFLPRCMTHYRSLQRWAYMQLRDQSGDSALSDRETFASSATK